jgi:hypothetical protein
MKRLLALTSLLLIAGCRTGERSTQSISRSWEAKGIQRLSLQGVNGEITIAATPRTNIVMDAEAVTRGRGRESAESLIETRIVGGTLEIREKSTRGDGWRVPIFSFGGSEREINYHIEVPEQIALDVTTVNGEVLIDGTKAACEIRSVNGAVEYITDDAPLVARTVNGSIDAAFRTSFPGAKLRTVNGPVEVTVPAGTKLSCSVSQVNGGFESNIPVAVNSGDSSATSRLQVSTVNGDVRVRKLEARDQMRGAQGRRSLRPQAPVPPVAPDAPELEPGVDEPEPPEPPDTPDAPSV